MKHRRVGARSIRVSATILVALAALSAIFPLLSFSATNTPSHPRGGAHLRQSSGVGLSKPIVQLAQTPDGQGYWLVGADGGIFTFGNAQFYGSTGALSLNQPIVGMA